MTHPDPPRADGFPSAGAWTAPAPTPGAEDPYPPLAPGDDQAAPTPEPELLTPRAVTASVTTVLTAILVAVATALPLPYAVTSPGETRDTLGEDNDTPLISIDGADTYDSSGKLLLTTVSVQGGPGYSVGLGQVLAGWVDGTSAVLPVEQLYPAQESRDEVDERNQAAMISSQENATVAALEELGYEVPTTLTVLDVLEGSGADGVVADRDVIVAVGGQAVTSFSDLSARMDEAAVGAPLSVQVERDGATVDLTVTPNGTTPDGRTQLGVFIDPTFDLPVDVTIQIENIGGPSAGTMFALGIIDKLTPEDEANGVTIAGTGTMDLTGAVGAIGGIRQKLNGAVHDGATWFLAPASNCDEVVGYVPEGLHVVSIATLSDARQAMTAIGAGQGDTLPTCD